MKPSMPSVLSFPTPLACCLAWLVVSLGWVAPAAAQGPENTLVVVRKDSPQSLAVANRFIELRNIPATNVMYIGELVVYPHISTETSHAKYFRSEILKPMKAHLKKNGIEEQITCVAYSADIPTRYNVQAELIKFYEHTGTKPNAKFYNPYASLTSMTFFNDDVYDPKPTFIGLQSNRYAGVGFKDPLANPFSGRDKATFDNALEALEAGKAGQAVDDFKQLASKHPGQAVVHFMVARCLADQEQPEEAFDALRDAVRSGWHFPKLTAAGLRPLSRKSEYRKIVRSMVPVPTGALPPRSFDPGAYWSENGSASGTAEQGKRYLLSTVLSVVGPRALKTKEALAQIDSSVAADGTFPKGQFYIAVHDDIRSKCRKRDLLLAAQELKSLGVKPVVDKAPWPSGQQNVAGATLGSGRVDWIESSNRFLPGALCDNLTSFGGHWAKTGQTQLSEFIKAGAAGASGTVAEPYAIPLKFPNSRLHVNYLKGSNLAEAFYQSVAGPFQLLVVGDPLCRPYAKFPKFRVDGIESGDTVGGEFELTVKLDRKSPSVGWFEVYLDGLYWTKLTSNKLLVPIESLSDGHHEIRIVGVRDTTTAARRSEVLDFVVVREAAQTRLTPSNLTVARTARVEFSIEPAEDFVIVHNGRVVGKAVNGTGSFPAEKLGQGNVKLQAMKADGSRASMPVKLEVTVP